MCSVLTAAAVILSAWTTIDAQAPPASQGQAPASTGGAPAPVEKLGDNRYRIGHITVDTAKRELSLPGTINDVSVLEFVANAKGGMKAYESALSLDTDAVTFNAACILIGLDSAHATGKPTRHFDPTIPNGDKVELWLELSGTPTQRIRVERLLYDKNSKKTVKEGPWVYTGSTIIETGPGQHVYLAENSGVLIGFVHSPESIIENPTGAGVGRYGSIILNPTLGLKPQMPVTLTVRALAK